MMKSKNTRKIKNKKSGIWILVYMFIGALVGMSIAGFGVYNILNNIVGFIDSSMKSKAFEIYMVVSLGFFTASLVFVANGIKRFRESISREDDVYDDKMLAIGMGMISMAYMSVFILLSPMSSAISDNPRMIKYTIAIIVMFFILIVGAIIQNKIVEEIKRGYPEKNGDVYDINFKRDWVNSMDEREKALMHEAAYKSFQITSNLIFAISLLLLIASIQTGSNNALALTLLSISATMQLTYIYYCIKLEKK